MSGEWQRSLPLGRSAFIPTKRLRPWPVLTTASFTLRLLLRSGEAQRPNTDQNAYRVQAHDIFQTFFSTWLLHIPCPTGHLCHAVPLVVHVQYSRSGGCSLTATSSSFLSLPSLRTYLLGRDSGADAHQLPSTTRLVAAAPTHQSDTAGASSRPSRVFFCLCGSHLLPPPTFCVRP